MGAMFEISADAILGMDSRLKNLSYSGLLTKHACPRKYQLSKLGAAADSEEDLNSSITFAFGHIVGEGIQLVMEGKSYDEIVWKLALSWHLDLFEENPKQKKSFFLALAAIQTFVAMRKAGYLKDWELVQYQGKPAVELSFRITLPNGFFYRGFVDAVLRNKVTGKIMVLECKTSSSFALNPATYKNSAQAVGYSVVLDQIAPEASSYEVHYLVYLTKQFEYEFYEFKKTYLQRALWIQEMLLDVQELCTYETLGVYPMRGESCLDWGRECEYLQTCTLSTKFLIRKQTEEEQAAALVEAESYQINVTLQQLIEAQLAKESEAMV